MEKIISEIRDWCQNDKEYLKELIEELHKIANYEIIKIQLKDICSYNDDFEYSAIYVAKDENFENKYEELVKICRNYDDFQEVEDFICENFKQVEVEEIIIEI